MSAIILCLGEAEVGHSKVGFRGLGFRVQGQVFRVLVKFSIWSGKGFHTQG